MISLDRLTTRRWMGAMAAVLALAALSLAGSGPAAAAPAQPTLPVSGPGLAGVGDLGLGWTAHGGQPGLDRMGAGRPARTSADERQAQVSGLPNRGHGFVRDARGFTTVDARSTTAGR